MKKNSFIQWFISFVNRDMKQYEEDVGIKKYIYDAVKRKTLVDKEKRWE